MAVGGSSALALQLSLNLWHSRAPRALVLMLTSRQTALFHIIYVYSYSIIHMRDPLCYCIPQLVLIYTIYIFYALCLSPLAFYPQRAGVLEIPHTCSSLHCCLFFFLSLSLLRLILHYTGVNYKVDGAMMVLFVVVAIVVSIGCCHTVLATLFLLGRSSRGRCNADMTNFNCFSGAFN